MGIPLLSQAWDISVSCALDVGQKLQHEQPDQPLPQVGIDVMGIELALGVISAQFDMVTPKPVHFEVVAPRAISEQRIKDADNPELETLIYGLGTIVRGICKDEGEFISVKIATALFPHETNEDVQATAIHELTHAVSFMHKSAKEHGPELLRRAERLAQWRATKFGALFGSAFGAIFSSLAYIDSHEIQQPAAVGLISTAVFSVIGRYWVKGSFADEEKFRVYDEEYETEEKLAESVSDHYAKVLPQIISVTR